MTALARASKGCGLTGTIVAHGVLLLAFLLLAEKAAPIVLPPPVEALRISLREPVAAPSPQPVVQAEPEPMPLPEPPPPIVEEKTPVAAKVTPPPKKREVRRQPRKPVAQAQPTPKQQVPVQTAQASPVPDAAAKEARQTLLSALIARIEKEKRYPPAARRLGLEGQVTAVVKVDSQGRIISVNVQGGGSHAILEKAASEAMNRVQNTWKPVPVPEPMTLHIPIHYTLS